MQRFLKVPLLLVAIATAAFGASPDETEVKSAIQQFHQALERRDVAGHRGTGFTRGGGVGERTSAKQTIDVIGKDGKHAGYLVWSACVLQKSETAWKVVLLDWCVKRLDAAD